MLVFAALGFLRVDAADREPTADPGAAAALSSAEDVAQRVAIVAQEKDLDQRLLRFEQLARGLALPEIQPALEAVASLRELRERVVLQRAVLMRWCKLAAPDAFAHIAALPESQLKLTALREAAVRFTRVDPARAADAALALPLSVSRFDAVIATADTWARLNPQEAFAWAQALPSSAWRDEALFAIGYAWAQVDPVSGAGPLEKLPLGELRANILAQVAYRWTALDPAAAIAWAKALPDADRQPALVNIAESWANTAPAEAGHFAETIADRAVHAEAVALVAQRWARQDPRKAGEWAGARTDAEARRRGAEAVIQLWTEVDAEECAQWVRRLTPPGDRDHALRTFVAAACALTPDLAASAAAGVENETLQVEAVNEALTRWFTVDRDSALKWLLDAPLPEAMKAEWLHRLPAGPGHHALPAPPP